MIGGHIVGWWEAAYPVDPPFGLAGWQAAYFAVGIPGLISRPYWVVTTVREPVRRDRRPSPSRRSPSFPRHLRRNGDHVPALQPVSLKRHNASGSLIAANASRASLPARRAPRPGDCIHQPATRTYLPNALIADIGGLASHHQFRIQWVRCHRRLCDTELDSIDPPARSCRRAVAAEHAELLLPGHCRRPGELWQLRLSTFIFLHGKTYLNLQAEDGWYLGAIAATAGGIGTGLGGDRRLGAPAPPFGPAVRRDRGGPPSPPRSALSNASTSSVSLFAANFSNIVPYPMAGSGGRNLAGSGAATHARPRHGGAVSWRHLIGQALGLTSPASSAIPGDLRLAMLCAPLPAPVAVVLFLIGARLLPLLPRPR